MTDELLVACGVRQWTELPLWRTFPGVWQVDAAKATTAGLACRPLADTVADTWSWMTTNPAQLADERASEIGISPEREREVLAAVG